MTKGLGLSAIVLALAVSASCTTHQADSAPPLAGPSGLAQTVTITATPDSITRDGQSQSAIVVRVFDAYGQPAAGVAVRLDMFVGGSLVDFGTLGARTVATASDGRATTVYTAPPALPTSSTQSNSALVTIAATPLGGNSQITVPFTTDIRLMPQGVIQPTIRFEPLFTFLPATPNQGAPIVFDASTTKDPDFAIVSYVWDFGDGTRGTGLTATHAFTRVGTFSVTLTALDALNRGASATKAVTVGGGDAPTALLTFSPLQSSAGDTVFFSAAGSKAAAGRSIVEYRWDFGDGASGSGVAPTHQYVTAGTYSVIVTVTDDVGVFATSNAASVAISSGAPVVRITSSPTTPGITTSVNFDASATTTSNGATITRYSWSFGDGTTSANGPVTMHTFGTVGSYTVTLTVTDSRGRIGTATATVTVS